MPEYYKIARPDGWDFHTGDTINYRDNIGKRVVDPQYRKDATCCNVGVIHASKNPVDALRWSKLPCSVYRVSGRPVDVRDDKAGFRSFHILEEIPESELSELFGFDYMRAAYPINPLEIDNEVTGADIDNFRKWAFVGNSVWDSVWDSVKDSMWDSVRGSVWDSMSAYIGTFFKLKQWKYVKHKMGAYPFQPVVDLLMQGLVASFDGKTWRLHGGKEAKIMFEISRKDLKKWKG